LVETVRAIDAQTRRPDQIIVSCVEEADIVGLPPLPELTIVFGASGLPRQRNTGLDRLDPDIDVVIFFDDDFIPHPSWIEATERQFCSDSEVDAITGHVVADGIKGPGLAVTTAHDLLNSAIDADVSSIDEGVSPYGCNMAFRRSSIDGLRFDERLVLYGWLEDRDFGGALARRGGRMIRLGAARGVHLGVKSSRSPGLRLGYSQVVNPVYLHRKGTMTLPSVVEHLLANVGSNLILSFRPELNVDRFGRFRGNMLGLFEILRGIAKPERAERL
jgi:glycosyltransferase involved in cell wall biosynthesis